MKKIVVREKHVGGHYYDELQIIMDNYGVIVITTLVYVAYLQRIGGVFAINKYDQNGCVISKFESNFVSQQTIRTYINVLYRFMLYLNKLNNHSEPTKDLVHHLYLLDTSTINHYLNKILPQTLSMQSLTTHCSGLKSFYNFLSYIGLCAPHEFQISRSARKQASQNDKSDDCIQYISSVNRYELLNYCTTQRDRLILRLGFEVGLRTSELCGLILWSEKGKGEFLLDLFAKLKDPYQAHKAQFGYTLLAQYTKRSKTRTIYFSRELLSALNNYHLTERLEILTKISSPHTSEPAQLLLRTDNRGFGEPIGFRQGSVVFSKYRKLMHLNPELGFHCLRHTFGTELYHSELLDNAGHETRSQSAALLAVAMRLGHSLGRNGLPQEVTTRYIRLREKMLEIETTE